MDLEEGMGVRIVRNLGEQSRYASDEYYHGGSISSVPLQTECRVQSVGSDRIVVRFKNGNTWKCHPNELEAIPNSFPEFGKGLEMPFLLRIAGKDPCLVLEDRLYQLDNPSANGRNFLEFAGKQYPLIELDHLANLEYLYEMEYADAIDELKSSLLADQSKSGVLGRDLKEKYSNLQIMQFLVDEVFPYLCRQTAIYNAALALAQGSDAGQDPSKDPVSINLQEQADKAISNAKAKKTLEPQKKEHSHFYDFNFRNFRRNLLIFNGDVFDLNNTEQRSKGLCLRWNNRWHTPQYRAKWSKMAKEYTDYLLGRFETELCKEGRESFAKTIEEQTKRVEERMKGIDFEKEQFGYEMKEPGRFLLYTKISEPYALKTGHGYFRMDPVKIALEVSSEHDEIAQNIIFPIPPYHKHPFVLGKNSICLDNWTPPTAYKMGQRIALLLLVAKNVFLSGYHRRHDNYTGTHINHLRGKEISLEEIKRQNLPITNEAVYDGRV